MSSNSEVFQFCSLLELEGEQKRWVVVPLEVRSEDWNEIIQVNFRDRVDKVKDEKNFIDIQINISQNSSNDSDSDSDNQ